MRKVSDCKGHEYEPIVLPRYAIRMRALVMLAGDAYCRDGILGKNSGDWQGTVGDMKETISFDADGKFVSEVRRQGFISNTLGQGITGTIRGTWGAQWKVDNVECCQC